MFHLPLWDYNPLSSNGDTSPSTTRQLKPKVSLWCSWHRNGTKINENLILVQAHKFLTHQYVPEYILIDDGWCTWADWFTPNPAKFSHGINRLAKKLALTGYQTGLWLAPFLVDPSSNLVKNHPDWLLKNPNGTFFNGFMSYPLIKDLTPKYLLDFTNPKVMGYLFKCLDIILGDWKITLLKLDHLYAPFFAPNSTKAELASRAITTFFTYIQNKYPHVYTIACGCPFNIATHRVDAIRISKDINSPHLNTVPLLGRLLYLKRRQMLHHKLAIATKLGLPYGIDPDAAINFSDAQKYHDLWQSDKIQVFGLGYNL